MGEGREELQLTCPECGFIAKNGAGLNGHRQFKHGIRSTAQPPLEPLDRLVTQTELTNELLKFDSRLYEAIEQVSEQVGQLKPWADQAASMVKRLGQLEALLDKVVKELPRIKGDILTCTGRIDKLQPAPESNRESKLKPGFGSIFQADQ